MPPIRPLHGINGRLRQHIHQLGRHYAVGHASERSRSPTPDAFLNELIASGELSLDDLQAITAQVQGNYGRYASLQDFSDRILDRADDVFLAKYGRCPREADWGGEYRQICERLRSNPRCYDDVLREWHQPTHGPHRGRAGTGKLVRAPLGARAMVVVVQFCLLFAAISTMGTPAVCIALYAVLILSIIVAAIQMPPYRCSSCRQRYGRRKLGGPGRPGNVLQLARGAIRPVPAS